MNRIIIKNVKIDHHRNGIAGEPFHVATFEHGERRMVGIVLDGAGQVAVLDVDMLAAGDIAFGSNSWRGDEFEGALRKAIAEWREAQA